MLLMRLMGPMGPMGLMGPLGRSKSGRNMVIADWVYPYGRVEYKALWLVGLRDGKLGFFWQK